MGIVGCSFPVIGSAETRGTGSETTVSIAMGVGTELVGCVADSPVGVFSDMTIKMNMTLLDTANFFVFRGLRGTFEWSFLENQSLFRDLFTKLAE